MLMIINCGKTFASLPDIHCSGMTITNNLGEKVQLDSTPWTPGQIDIHQDSAWTWNYAQGDCPNTTIDPNKKFNPPMDNHTMCEWWTGDGDHVRAACAYDVRAMDGHRIGIIIISYAKGRDDAWEFINRGDQGDMQVDYNGESDFELDPPP